MCSALAVDPSGARVATGSHDYDAKIWDFGGMDARLKPFKSWEPNGNYYVSQAVSIDEVQCVVRSNTDFDSDSRRRLLSRWAIALGDLGHVAAETVQ